jgi:hypothetical protein
LTVCPVVAKVTSGFTVVVKSPNGPKTEFRGIGASRPCTMMPTTSSEL